MTNKITEYNRQAVTELHTKGIALMAAASAAVSEMRAEIRVMRGVYRRLPAETRLPEFEQSLNDLEALLNNAESDISFADMGAQLRRNLDRLAGELPLHDGRLANELDNAIDMTRSITAMVGSLMGVIPPALEGNHALMADRLAESRQMLADLGKSFGDDMGRYLLALKGIMKDSTAYSPDPVNLTTGNFIYEKEDMDLKGSYPLTFRRFYNAINGRSGSMGDGWNHSFEVYVEEKDGMSP